MLYHMSTKKLKQIENQIQKIKDELWEMGEMRPGSLTVQYKVPKEKKGPYYQLSYTHKMRSRTNMCGRNLLIKPVSKLRFTRDLEN